MLKKVVPAVFLLLAFCSRISLGQRNIGVDWAVPANELTAQKQLQQFAELGISTLKIDRRLPADLWPMVERMGFKVYVQLPFKFPVAYNLNETEKKGLPELRSYVSRLNSLQPVTAIGLFSYGSTSDPAFRQAARALAKVVRSETSKHLFYLTTPSDTSSMETLVYFKMVSIAPDQATTPSASTLYLYQPDKNKSEALAPVKKILQRTANHPAQPLFFASPWLLNIIKTNATFKHTLSLYTQTVHPGFPLPQEAGSPSSDFSLIALMLLLMWMIFALTYNYNPIYQRSFLRYFGGHSFYVSDVMKRHIRQLSVGFSILVQHGISGGIALYGLFFTFTGVLGQQALYHHYPFLAWLGTGRMSIFLWGLCLTLATEILMMGWLWIAHPKNGVFTQLMNLYPWTLQLNLVTATLLTVIFLSTGNHYLIYTLGLCFLLLFNAAFIVTCFDTANYVSSKRHWYLSGTLALYLLIVGALAGWIIFSPVLGQVIELIASLP